MGSAITIVIAGRWRSNFAMLSRTVRLCDFDGGGFTVHFHGETVESSVLSNVLGSVGARPGDLEVVLLSTPLLFDGCVGLLYTLVYLVPRPSKTM
jgi:hypothetical protein